MENCEKSYMDPSIDEELVGFDDDVEKITEYLTRGKMELDVISIVGMAGIGKTALARKIYNSSSIINHFDVRAWCCISQIYDRRKLWLEILKQFTGLDHKYADLHDAADTLRKCLYKSKYLIVLDDIWDTKAWDDLRLSFRCRNNGNRIMLTTRVKEVALFARVLSDPYLLPLLKDEKSWELLQKKVFQGENNESCPLELLNVGQLVARRCKGLPSLIIKIAGILSSKKREASLWLEVAYNISCYALDKEMIQLSYDNLEDHLKPCLLYMGLFPKNYEIPVSDLLKWWIAEEFMQDDDTLVLERLSENCLFYLVDRNLVMVSKRRSNGEMKCCIVPDQVREFCLTKITEEKFMQLIVPCSKSRLMYEMRKRGNNPHEIKLPVSKKNNPHELEGQRLRMYIHDTLTTSNHFKESRDQEFIVHPKFSKLDRKNPFRLLNSLRLVRVLHLLDIYLDDSLAVAFQSLAELRYLAVFVKAFDFKWVSNLLHLQTLKVRSSYIMISSGIWKMAKLRHVDINEFPITTSCEEEEDDSIVLDNLKTLGMCYMSVADMTPKFWEKFPNLEQLRLHINEFGDHVPNQHSRMNLDVIFPSCHLRCLSLSEIFLTDEIVSSIAKLRYLETLKLSEIYFTGEKHWDLSHDNTFEDLKLLKLHRVFMTKWSCSHDSFPELQNLVVKSCSKLEEIPLTLKKITKLRSIKVINCNDSVGNSAMKIKEEKKSYRGSILEVHILKKDK